MVEAPPRAASWPSPPTVPSSDCVPASCVRSARASATRRWGRRAITSAACRAHTRSPTWTSRRSACSPPRRPSGPYRGAGRPEAAFLIERLVDEAARALALDPAELRRRNLVPPERFPFATATGQSYDSGDYPELLARVLAAADYAALRRAQAERRARGELVGVGLSVYVEPSALGWESGLVRVEADGRVTAATGSSAHGQGHETVFAQIVADRLGVEPEAIEVRHGDTAAIGRGIGTFGSRSTALGGGALVHAAEAVVAKARRLAGHLLEPHGLGVPDGF